jgi:hypothetical protein
LSKEAHALRCSIHAAIEVERHIPELDISSLGEKGRAYQRESIDAMRVNVTEMFNDKVQDLMVQNGER